MGQLPLMEIQFLFPPHCQSMHHAMSTLIIQNMLLGIHVRYLDPHFMVPMSMSTPNFVAYLIPPYISPTTIVPILAILNIIFASIEGLVESIKIIPRDTQVAYATKLLNNVWGNPQFILCAPFLSLTVIPFVAQIYSAMVFPN